MAGLATAVASGGAGGRAGRSDVAGYGDQHSSIEGRHAGRTGWMTGHMVGGWRGKA